MLGKTLTQLREYGIKAPLGIDQSQMKIGNLPNRSTGLRFAPDGFLIILSSLT